MPVPARHPLVIVDKCEAERYRQLVDLMDAAERRRLEELLQIRLVSGDAIETR